jgi:hypothetical protein
VPSRSASSELDLDRDQVNSNMVRFEWYEISFTIDFNNKQKVYMNDEVTLSSRVGLRRRQPLRAWDFMLIYPVVQRPAHSLSCFPLRYNAWQRVKTSQVSQSMNYPEVGPFITHAH